MAGKMYRIRIVKADRQFEAEGDKAFVLEMLKRYDSSEIQTGTTTSSSLGKATKHRISASDLLRDSSAGKALSVGEFIRQLGFKKHTDIVLAFGYYLEKQGTHDFTPADINSCYYEAKMENSNTSQMCISNIRRGYMMEAKHSEEKGRKRYTLTQSGESYITAKATKKPD
jgi:hypothetical protein